MDSLSRLSVHDWNRGFVIGSHDVDDVLVDAAENQMRAGPMGFGAVDADEGRAVSPVGVDEDVGVHPRGHAVGALTVMVNLAFEIGASGVYA